MGSPSRSAMSSGFSARTYDGPQPYPRSIQLLIGHELPAPAQGGPSTVRLRVRRPFASINSDPHDDETNFINTLVENYFPERHRGELDEPPLYWSPREWLPPYRQATPNPVHPYGTSLPPPYARQDPLLDFEPIPPRAALARPGTPMPSRTKINAYHVSSLRSPEFKPPVAPRSIAYRGPDAKKLLRAPRTLRPRAFHTPSFAMNMPLKRFSNFTDLEVPPKSFIINVPFTGEYWPFDPNRVYGHNLAEATSALERFRKRLYASRPKAISVYARYDFLSDRVWIAVRCMSTSPDGLDRYTELKWLRFDEFVAVESNMWRSSERYGRQKFVARHDCQWMGNVNEQVLMSLWDTKNIIGEGPFAGADLI